MGFITVQHCRVTQGRKLTITTDGVPFNLPRCPSTGRGALPQNREPFNCPRCPLIGRDALPPAPGALDWSRDPSTSQCTLPPAQVPFHNKPGCPSIVPGTLQLAKMPFHPLAVLPFWENGPSHHDWHKSNKCYGVAGQQGNKCTSRRPDPVNICIVKVSNNCL